MRGIITILTLSVATAGVVAPASAQSLQRGRVLPTASELARFGLERAWWAQATIDPTRSTVRHMSLDEENLYVQSTQGIVTAFDNETGSRLWASQLGRSHDPSFPIVTNTTRALVVTGLTVYCLDKFSGELVWKLNVPKQPSTRPSIDDEQLYIGTLDGSMFAFDLERIQELYNENRLPQWSNNAINWRFKTAREITTPAVTGGRVRSSRIPGSPSSGNVAPPEAFSRVVNFASRDGSLYAVTTIQRDLSWQFETDRPISAPLGHSDGLLFLASEDASLYCINSQNGRALWRYVFGFPIRTAPRVVGDDVYVVPLRGGLYCLSKNSGVLKYPWRPELNEFLASTLEYTFAADDLGNVAILSRENGGILGFLPMRDFSVHLNNDRTDRLYMSTPSGLVVCIRRLGQEFPIYHKYPERLPILPELAPEDTPPDPEPDPTAIN